jgi:hypothetical protein
VPFPAATNIRPAPARTVAGRHLRSFTDQFEQVCQTTTAYPNGVAGATTTATQPLRRPKASCPAALPSSSTSEAGSCYDAALTSVTECYRAVTALHRNVDREFTDVTVVDEAGVESVVKTTQNHPFWNASAKEWTGAADLELGDELKVEGAGASSSRRSATMWVPGRCAT